jgi:4-coumarate--CoA ligase (photoactive yellow protein activation family)
VKSFCISEEQITRVIGAACADQVSRQFNRHLDFLTIASWGAETPFGRGGAKLSEAERAACERRAASFFGLDDAHFDARQSETIGDWAREIFDAISKRLKHFAFKASARDDIDAAAAHRADEIFQDAAAAANAFYGRRRLISFVSPHSLLGFVLTVVTPNLQKIETVDARGMAPEALSSTLAYGDVLIATPSLWRYLIREKLVAPDNTMAVAFGEPMTAELAADMRKAGFGVMRELYGTTENGLIGWRDSPGEAFLLFDHWRREGEDLIRLSPDGAERAASAMDILDWSDKRSFHLGGRRDGAVQIGAVNVSPKDVAARLCGHPHIVDCRVRVGRRGDGVNTLIAHIVLDRDSQPNERTAREIDAWCRKTLRQQERPRIFHFEPALHED